MPAPVLIILCHNLTFNTKYHDNKNFLCYRIFIGPGNDFSRCPLFLSPEVATAGFGIHFNADGDYSFQHIKGIRDIFSGLLICAFVLMNERQPLGVTLLAGTIIPVNDMLIVFSKSYNGVLQAMPHILAIIICAVFGVILLATKPQNKAL